MTCFAIWWSVNIWKLIENFHSHFPLSAEYWNILNNVMARFHSITLIIPCIDLFIIGFNFDLFTSKPSLWIIPWLNFRSDAVFVTLKSKLRNMNIFKILFERKWIRIRQHQPKVVRNTLKGARGKAFIGMMLKQSRVIIWLATA